MKNSWHKNSFLNDHTPEFWESIMNQELNDLFHNIDLQASTKSDPKSLPYQDSIGKIIGGDSYLNAVWGSRKRFYRKVVGELLSKGIGKIRFFTEISQYNYNTGNEKKDKFFNNIGGGNTLYSFNYYIHE